MKLTIALLGSFLCSMLLVGQARTSPQKGNDVFARYKVVPKFHGAPAKPVLSNAEDRYFRTRIRKGAAAGPVFADHYAVAVWGCGAGCISFAIVDSISGKVYDFPPTLSGDDENDESLTFHRDSRAMHIIGRLNEKDSADRWYVWNGTRLVLIARKPAERMGDPVDATP